MNTARYRAAHAVEAGGYTIIVMVLLGLPLTFFAGGGFLIRLPFGNDPRPQPG